MLVVKGNIYRNVSEQEAEAYKQQGYSPVSNQPTVKRGGKRGDTK